MKVQGAVFRKEDLEQIRGMGLTPEKVRAQIEAFAKGFPFLQLYRPCTAQDGIKVLATEQIIQYDEIFNRARLCGRAMKFVPASGAASRMFKLLIAFNKARKTVSETEVAAMAEKGDPDCIEMLRFIKGVKKFPFYEDLRAVMDRDGFSAEKLIEAGEFKEILDYLLTPRGLNITSLPKGVIKFHSYGKSRSRTPFEEQIAEAIHYLRDQSGRIRIHFTISPEYEEKVKDHVEKAKALFQGPDAVFILTFSSQSSSTDTIAVDMENRPFRDTAGRLVFRPGGHGALLENLNRLEGDIVFIKNIDNVLPDHRREDTYLYKRALGGLLLWLQGNVFHHLEHLLARDSGDRRVDEASAFAEQHLSFLLPKGLSREEKRNCLVSRLNRPIRVCGMVRNEGEPGGGPFWVRQEDGTVSRQIVEASQVDMSSPGQREIWESSTHFNPVDLVCALRDYQGKPFALEKFTNPETGFISIKSVEGRDLKALEVPGLWNGAMAGWNTVFAEVPLSTFSPVKTLHDLLRKEHQP
ncbi:MAG: DUF4301 family protein [Deltaproteobacteria bacterium]|nr:DUF4301 family protein [Deltaproteobacteria bacterium]